ncbi:microfibril-associated glycoprotein 4-like [Saccostrea echinata]|uniref:microfibril-associated glycoprotein 4-like n=1 Tax=Saccostrea echinata TaxID=191078 RepID=UPI002A800B71|nr:microfibril-associated glycoprotein 4-like [Saccostrea echinata]
MCGVLYISPQQIYLNEKNDCFSSEKINEGFQILLTEHRTLQREIDQQRQETVEIIDLLNNSTLTSRLQHEVDELRRENVEIRNLLNNFTRTSRFQHEVDELRRENVEIRNLLNNFTLTSRFQQEVDELRRENKEIRDLLNNLTLKSLKVNVDCKDLYREGHTRSGVYGINPFGNETQINVFCDMENQGGGWTAIQKRKSGSVSFFKTWVEYKTGFGNAEDTYWIGNDVIHKLTKGRNSSLFVSIALQNGTTLYELYQQFSVSDESDNYELFLGGPATGTLGDSVLDPGRSDSVLSGVSFSTPDRDNDMGVDRNCAAVFKGGWWFRNCYSAFLNGPWSSASWLSPWHPTIVNGRDIKETLMMIKTYCL